MDGLGRAIGAPGTWRAWSGEMYLVSPLTLGDLGTVENHLLAQRQHPLEIIESELHKLPDDAHRTFLIDRAKSDLRKKKFIVTVSELMEWIETWEGTQFTAWLCLRQHHELSCYQAGALIRDECDGTSFRRVRNLISGLDRATLYDWPDPKYADTDDKKSKPLAYRQLVQSLTIDIGMSIDSIRQLTPYMIKVLCSDKDILKGTRKVSGHAARQFARNLGGGS